MALSTPEPELSLVSLEEQVLQIRLQRIEAPGDICNLLKCTSEAGFVAQDSIVFQEGLKKLRKLAFANLYSMQDCKILIQMYEKAHWWPADNNFRRSAIKRIYEKAKTWREFEFVVNKSSPRSKIYMHAQKQMRTLLQIEYETKLTAVESPKDARVVLCEFENFCYHHPAEDYWLRFLITKTHELLVSFPGSFDDYVWLLSRNWLKEEERESFWQLALQMANDVRSLFTLSSVEVVEGACLRKALDLCSTTKDCLDASRVWRKSAESQEFIVKAIDVASSFKCLEEIEPDLTDMTMVLFERYKQKQLNLASTEDELSRLYNGLNSLILIYRETARRMRNQTKAKLTALYINQFMHANTFREFYDLYLNERVQGEMGVKAFEHACAYAASSEEFLKLYKNKPVDRPTEINLVDKGLLLAAKQPDPMVALPWIDVLDLEDPWRERAMRLFIEKSKA